MKRLYFITLILLLAFVPIIYAQRVQPVKVLNPGGSNAETYRTLENPGVVDLNVGGFNTGIGLGSKYHLISWHIYDGTFSACSIKVIAASSASGTFGDLIPTQTCTSDGQSALYAGENTFIDLNFESRTVSSGVPLLVVTYRGFANDPTLLTSTTVTNATVTNTGTFATQADVTKILGTAVSATNGLPVYPQTSASFTVAQGTAANLKTQAEAYQGGSAVDLNNGLFVQPSNSASFTVGQATATNLKTAAELYVAGAANSLTNGAFVTPTTANPAFAISAASLPLPALAATSTKQSDGTQKTQVVDGAGNVIGATSNAMDVNIKSGGFGGAVTNAGTFAAQADITKILGTAVSATNGLPVYPQTAATFPVSLASVPSHAVTNAGTFAAQVTGTGTAGTPPGGATVLTVQGAASMTPVLVAPNTADAAPGATRTNPPVPTAGSDYTGAGGPYVQIPKVSSAGTQYFDLVSVAGTGVTATAGLPVKQETNAVWQQVSGPPAANYNLTVANKTSNGTTTVNAVAAVTNYSIVVDAISIVNTNATTGFVVYLCDGACSTANWIPLPAPTALTAGGGVSGAVIGGLNFSTTKSAQLDFKCATDCTSTVLVGVTYHTVLRP
jgi:hypothetical protein